jgi:RNA polymerase sigma-70 factor (ECF subfamily)
MHPSPADGTYSPAMASATLPAKLPISMAVSGEPERDLAARLRRRDPTAVEELHGRYGGMVFGYLLRVLGDRGTAEDVHQQVFLEVWERGRTYDPERGGPSTWIMTIARSRAIDQLRRRVPEPRDPTAALALREDPSGDAELFDRWWLAAVLAELPAQEQRVLRMRFADGLTQVEIAERLDVPLGTVKSWMGRGLARLRATMERPE